MVRRRIDQLLCELGIAPSREKAQAYILAGEVLVDDRVVDKPGQKVPENAEIRLRNAPSRFVGRGGEKIDPILEQFGINLQDRIALDIGASTGGFTDAMLQRGAARVYAVDVGYNQLHHRLRTDPRVVVMERSHVKDLRSEQFNPPPTFVTIDVSFIGVRKILPGVLAFLTPPVELLILVKPQFELEREFVGKGGVVREEAHQLEAVRLVKEAGVALGLIVCGEAPSPLRGDKQGNQEYFLHFEFR